MLKYYCNLGYKGVDNMKLEDCQLFHNTRVDISHIIIQDYPSGYTFALEAEVSKYLGIVLEGRILVKAYTLGGNNFTLNVLEKGKFFGDILMFSNKTNAFPGSLITQGNTKIALIPNDVFQKFLFNDNDLLKNFLRLLSNNAYEMSYKSKLLSQDSVRDKILYFLFQEKRLQKTNKIKLQMTKEELANQLFIQRPSLSRELSKMKKEGIIDYDRYSITIIK